MLLLAALAAAVVGSAVCAPTELAQGTLTADQSQQAAIPLVNASDPAEAPSPSPPPAAEPACAAAASEAHEASCTARLPLLLCHCCF